MSVFEMDQTSNTILLAEDSDEDIFIFNRAVKLARVTNPIRVVHDGEDVVDYLAGTGRYSNRADSPLPFLVLLDLKLPRMGGLDTLKWIREQPQLGGVSVVMLTCSAQERDVVRAYQLGARSYLVKPPTAGSLLAVVNAVQASAELVRDRLRIEEEKDPGPIPAQR